jgi:hypothetical protein
VSQRVTIKQGVKKSTARYSRTPPTFARCARSRSHAAVSPFRRPLRREGHKAALLESDGGAWRVEAVRYIGNYLKDKLQIATFVVNRVRSMKPERVAPAPAYRGGSRHERLLFQPR